MTDSPAMLPANPHLATVDRLAALLILIGTRRVRAAFAASITDPATDPDQRSQMRRLLADHHQSPE